MNAKKRLTTDEVTEIRNLLDTKVAQTVIAARFGVCVSTVSDIKTGRNWKEDSDNQKSPKGKLTPVDVLRITELLEKGWGLAVLAQSYNVRVSDIAAIKNSVPSQRHKE